MRDEGTAYRTAGGRGYSSNAELDFHTDSADVVVLTTYNKAASGGMSIVTSSIAAYERMAKEYPQLVGYLPERPLHGRIVGVQHFSAYCKCLAMHRFGFCKLPLIPDEVGDLAESLGHNRVFVAEAFPGHRQ